MNLRRLEGILPQGCILQNEPMKRHTTFQTGGPADLLLLPQTEDQLISTLRALREAGLSFHLIGRGSNLLVSDEGVRGAVVKLAFGSVKADGNLVTADAGVPLRSIFQTAVRSGLAGLEFAAGIPGSLGGGVVMNAGAYGGELKDVIRSARVLDRDLRLLELSGGEMEFSYRSSAVEKKGYTVLSAIFSLPFGNEKDSWRIAEEFAARRREKQPLEFPSAGSTFKRPEGHFAGALIEQCGLKGASLGGAQVSVKHAGFIINAGGATSSDIYRLIQQVRRTVREETGVPLVPEVRFLGEFEV